MGQIKKTCQFANQERERSFHIRHVPGPAEASADVCLKVKDEVVDLVEKEGCAARMHAGRIAISTVF
jgi:hypothetical protein